MYGRGKVALSRTRERARVREQRTPRGRRCRCRLWCLSSSRGLREIVRENLMTRLFARFDRINTFVPV